MYRTAATLVLTAASLAVGPAAFASGGGWTATPKPPTQIGAKPSPGWTAHPKPPVLKKAAQRVTKHHAATNPAPIRTLAHTGAQTDIELGAAGGAIVLGGLLIRVSSRRRVPAHR